MIGSRDRVLSIVAVVLGVAMIGSGLSKLANIVSQRKCVCVRLTSYSEGPTSARHSWVKTSSADDLKALGLRRPADNSPRLSRPGLESPWPRPALGARGSGSTDPMRAALLPLRPRAPMARG